MLTVDRQSNSNGTPVMRKWVEIVRNDKELFFPRMATIDDSALLIGRQHDFLMYDLNANKLLVGKKEPDVQSGIYWKYIIGYDQRRPLN